MATTKGGQTGVTRSWLAERAWIGLFAVAVLTILLSLLDLASDARTGLPADHAAAYQSLTSVSWDTARSTAPARFVTVLETGYALHELVYALFVAAIAAVPFRRGERWAWFPCWGAVLAAGGYALLMGSHNPTTLVEAGAETIFLAACLLLAVPRFFVAAAPVSAP